MDKLRAGVRYSLKVAGRKRFFNGQYFPSLQRMLLHDLYETKVCNSLLYPESDEDIWKHEDLTMSVSPLGVHITKGDSKGGK